MPKSPKKRHFFNSLACMAWQQKHTFCMVLLLLLMVECKCGGQHSEPTNQEQADPETPTPASIPAGIWHTGTFAYEIKPTPPQSENEQVAHLYNHTFHMYRVSHDGSCGFRSFIPILLADILVNNKWQAWLDKIKTTYYEPAQAVLKNLGGNLKSTIYDKAKNTDNPNQLIKDVYSLLQKLAQESKPRPLQEPEIKLLVDFLRQTFLMEHIQSTATQKALEDEQNNARKNVIYAIEEEIKEGEAQKNAYQTNSEETITKIQQQQNLSKHPQEHIGREKIREDIEKSIAKKEALKEAYQKDPEATIEEQMKERFFFKSPKEAIDSFFGSPYRNDRNFWAEAHEFACLFVPYLFLNKDAVHYNVTYFYDKSPDYRPDLFPKQPPTIWLYRHDDAYFEYLICDPTAASSADA